MGSGTDGRGGDSASPAATGPVVVLRLFASARRAAGTGRLECTAATVGDVVALAEARFGEEFTEVLAISRIWVNGVEAAPERRLVDGDEVAVLPPVSGGSPW